MTTAVIVAFVTTPDGTHLHGVYDGDLGHAKVEEILLSLLPSDHQLTIEHETIESEIYV